MAKGNWLLGGVSGKVGDLVLSKLNGKQVTRARNRSPKNPKTSGQAMQRMKFGALAAFYSAFEREILDHSWQNVKYGGPSHNFFYKQALSSSIKTPAVEKGSHSFVPSNYPMSRGTLQAVQTSFQDDTELYTDIAFDWSASGSSSIGAFIDAFVTANPYYAGKQLTFVLISLEDGNFIPNVARIIFDKSAYTEDVLNKQVTDIIIDGIYLEGDEFLAAYLDKNRTIKIAAGCVIVSEWTGTIWARSNSDLVINEYVMPKDFFQGDYFSAALKTYMDSSTASTEFSEKYLNGAGSVPATGIIPVSSYLFSSTAINVKIGETTYKNITLNAMALVMSDGSWRLPSTDGTINGKPIVYGDYTTYIHAIDSNNHEVAPELTWKQLQDANMSGVSDISSKLIAFKEEYNNLPKK